MWKKYAGILAFAGLLLLAGCREKESIPVSFSTSSLEEENPVDTLGDGDLPGEEIPVYEVELPEELSSFAAAIWGEVYEFPVSWQEFAERGWKYQGDPEQMVDARSYLEGESFEKDGNLLHVYLLNPAGEMRPAEQCTVAGIRLDTRRAEEHSVYVNLPGGITLQQSVEADVIHAYGEPVDRYEGENGVVLTYEYGTYRSVQLGFDSSTGLLTTLDLKNVEETEETVPVHADLPEEVREYREPEEPGDTLADSVVEYDGVLYRLPVPVRELESRGWILNEQESDSSVEGGQYGQATLEKDGAKFYTVVRNSAGETAAVNDCLVTSLFSDLDTVKVPMVLAGGITLGMSEKDFLEAAGDAVFVRSEDAEQDRIVYTFYRGESEADYTEVAVDGSLKLVRSLKVVCNDDRELEGEENQQ